MDRQARITTDVTLLSNLKTICIISETQNDEAWDTLNDMYYELTDKYNCGLRILIPDSVENQDVFDVFNPPSKTLHVITIVGTYGKRRIIEGKPNTRSLFVDLKVQQNVVEMIGKYESDDKEFHRVGRTHTVQNRSEIGNYFISLCHIFVGLWHDGDILKPLAQYANHIGREVVIVDI